MLPSPNHDRRVAPCPARLGANKAAPAAGGPHRQHALVIGQRAEGPAANPVHQWSHPLPSIALCGLVLLRGVEGMRSPAFSWLTTAGPLGANAFWPLASIWVGDLPVHALEADSPRLGLDARTGQVTAAYCRVGVTSPVATDARGTTATMAQTNADLIWKIADLLRGPYQPNQYGDVILPFTILRRLDCILELTKGGGARPVQGRVDVHRRCRSRRHAVSGLALSRRTALDVSVAG